MHLIWAHNCCNRYKTSDFKQAAAVEVDQVGKRGTGGMGMGTGQVRGAGAPGGGGTELTSG